MLKSIFSSPSLTPIIMGQLRHYVSAGGASLATYGYMAGSQVEVFTGAVMTLLGIVLSAISKKMAA